MRRVLQKQAKQCYWMCTTRPICDIEKIWESFIFVVNRTIFLKTNNFRRIRRALLAYVRCGGLALKGLINIVIQVNGISYHLIYIYAPNVTSLYNFLYNIGLMTVMAKTSSH